MRNKVIASFETGFEDQCLDIFQRADGTFGFEEFRRDLENHGLWQSLGKYSEVVFVTSSDAIRTADRYVIWLASDVSWAKFRTQHGIEFHRTSA